MHCQMNNDMTDSPIDLDVIGCNVDPQSTQPELSLEPPTPIEDLPRRKRGRPKGPTRRLEGNARPRRPIGRPAGSGPRQLEQVLLGEEGVVKKRRPVGRLRKHIPAEIPSYSIALGDGRVVRISLFWLTYIANVSTACSSSIIAFANKDHRARISIPPAPTSSNVRAHGISPYASRRRECNNYGEFWKP